MPPKKPRAKPKPSTSLSKQQEAEVMRVYNAYWSNYTVGDVEAMAPLLDEDYTQVGSAEAEVFFNKKDAVEFLHDTIDQVAGKAELRNRVIRVEPQKEFVLVTELTDLFVLIESEWTFHSKFRASSLMRKRKGGWKFYHQHSSFPDIRAQEGENISIEKVALENLQLRDAVKRRTVDLEQKTRDLEVEAALERVRARAMGMRNSSELAETSAVLFHQIKELGINAIRTGVGIFDDPNNAMELWLTTVSESNEVVRILDYVNLHIHPVFENIIPARKANKPYAVTVLKGNEVKQYYSTMSTYLSLPSQKKYNQEESFYSFFFSDGAINVITTQPLTAEECSIMVRLASVFGVIYTRFQDLEKAEAQAREARIETSLERIRSKALAMHQSNDLAGVVDALYSELSALDFGIHQILLSIYDIDNHVIEWWSRGYTEGDLPQRNLIPIIDHAFSNLLLEQWRSGADSWTYNLEGDIKQTWDEYLFTKTDLQHFPKEVKEIMRGLKSVWLSDAFMKHGSLQAAGPTPLADDKVQILKRFAKVIDLAYTRMVDLQNAEAQAREAQIEVALERVRASAMAMHRSEDVGSAMLLMFDQLNHLGIRAERCGICIPMDSSTMEFWTATSNESGESVRVIGQESFDLHIALRNAYQAWKDKKEHQTYSLKGEDLIEYYRAVKATMPVLEWREKMHGAKGGQEYLETFPFADGWLYTFTNKELSEDGIQILVRFAKVFGLTYRRYLDLQVAEAQAREAQIEAALERVRSRSMAMHKSEELREVIQRVFDQLRQLGFNIDSASFDMNHGIGLDFDLWTAVPGQLYSTRQYVPFFDSAWFNKKKHAKENGLDFFTVRLTHEEKNDFYRHFFKHHKDVPEERQKFIFDSPGVGNSTIVMGNISLIANNYTGILYSEEENAILRRFGKVFEQSYTRFLDLQKAEAQAREAQIEAALERVRSRSMAMHKSEQLADVIGVISEQLQHLNVRFDNVSFATNNDSDDYDFWISVSGRPQPYRVRAPHRAPDIDNPMIERVRDARRQGMKFYQDILTPQENKPWLAHLFANNTIDFLTTETKAYMLSSGFARSVAIMPNILLVLGNYASKPYSEEDNQIIKRFASVFEQSYTRFLDLQKAEVQAREAQIEASLERVRSRMMAMHQSEDLPEVMKVITEQFTQLGFDIHAASFLPDITNIDLHCWISTPQKTFPVETFIPYFDHLIFNRIREVVDSKLDSLVLNVSEEDTRSWWNNFLTKSNVSHLSEKGRNIVLSISVMSISMAVMKYTLLSIWNYHGKPFSEEENAILKRFAKVAEQTYTRYLELRKAEAQAREGQIELALERIRARTMAMQKSDELREIITVVFQQFQELSFKIDSTYFDPDYKETDDLHAWIASTARTYPTKIDVPYFDNEFFRLLKKAKEDGQELATGNLIFDEKNRFWEQFFMHASVAPERQEYVLSSPGFALSCALMNNVAVAIINYQGIPFSNAENSVLLRFGKVFQQSYTRFLDLEKAEAQAREAQIEAALERARSSMMAMHQSDVLPDVIKVVAEQFVHLGIRMDTVLFFPTQQRDDLIFWTATTERSYPIQVAVPYADNPFFPWIHKAIRETIEFSTICLTHEETQHWWNNFFEKSNTGPLITEERKKYILASKGLWCSAASRKNSTLAILSYSGPPFSDEENAILKRFASVFEQAYTRFLDIQKAEAQAREASIEASLEKVRSSALAMKEPADMLTVCRIISDQLHVLNFKDIRNVQTIIINESKFEYINYQYFAPYDKNSVEQIDYRGHPVELELAQQMLTSKEAFYSKTFEGNELEVWREHRKRTHQLPDPKLDQVSAAYYYFFSIGQGALGVTAYSALSEVDLTTFKRFRNVFELAYRRYIDIEQSRSQAREARIEASLERVRAKAMAMHSSRDLSDSIEVFYKEVLSLGVQPRRVGVALTDRESKVSRLTTFSTSEQGETVVAEGNLKMEGHLVLEEAFNHWLRQEEYHASLKGKEINDYYKVVRPQIAYPDYSHDATQHGYYFMFPEGNVVTWTENELPEEELKIFRRFTSVISLTYKRYKDLSDAEARTQLAVREASLDRVRAEIASMRSTNDLNRITPLIWSELTTLGVPFVRCGLHIMDDEKKLIYNYLSTPDGKAISTADGKPVAFFQIPFDISGFFSRVVNHWQERKIYKEHLDKSGFAEIATTMVHHGVFATEQQYLSTLTHTNLDAHFVPFLQGMLYVANTAPLSEAEINLVQSLADAFSTAYARYEDFNKLESAKAQIENTLTDLKQTQTQLVQSEKMASLGELTAGIAHEIQNPLNFVNNFSEVSGELLDEMVEEVKKGNLKDIQTLVSDIKQNLDKIHFHGKRADGIVKSMLQHSRKSTNQKEPTDINALCDEYLRLSYHGLRAKDKSFNAKFETQLDPNVGKLNVIPQEIGRVILNLINNAFYAVSEKKKLNLNNYEPTVTVTTKKTEKNVEVRVRDNGIGIPQKVLDKIFNPFFTTKPTGQGTGLGLSLSYDIITKGHGGELKVETKEGEGSEFIVQLPVL